jgi:hypothetical protein
MLIEGKEDSVKHQAWLLDRTEIAVKLMERFLDQLLKGALGIAVTSVPKCLDPPSIRQLRGLTVGGRFLAPGDYFGFLTS